MLGFYESIRWWDHLTHTVSAALVAALIYAGVTVSVPGIAGIGNSPGVVGTMTVMLTFAIGLLWELIELAPREVGEQYDIEPVPINYGWRDTAVDLGFDIVGSLLVVGTELRILVSMMEQFPGVAGGLIIGISWVILIGSMLRANLIGHRRVMGS